MMLGNNLALKREHSCYENFYNADKIVKKRIYHNLNRDSLSRNFLSTYEKGISAERIASKILTSEGYEILGNRIRTGYGEIDILAKKGNNIVAVEVKQRKTLVGAKCCITSRQQKRISNALLYIASERNKSLENYRIDVICLDAVGRFEHIENAFSINEPLAC